MVEQTNQLKTGVFLSYINLAISSLIPFLYTPIMLDMLGQSEYGLYSLANSVVGYLSLLSFGFGSTIVRYLSKYRAENKTKELESTYGFFLFLYGLLSVAVFVGGIILSGNVNAIFSAGLKDEEISKIDDNTFTVDGTIDIEEVDELIGKALPDGDYETLAGFIMDELQCIPKDGEMNEVVFENVKFTVLSVEDRRIEKIKVEITPEENEETEENEDE